MKKSVIVILFCFLLTSCATKSFNINKVNFSYEYKDKYILPLKYHDRSSSNFETSEKIMKGLLTADSNTWGYYYVHHSVDTREVPLYTFEILGIPITDILQLFGIPKSRMHYSLKANVYLFDSNGDIIEIDERASSIIKYKGWYYGYNPPIEEMSGEYKKMFSEVLNDIGKNKARINNLLETAGTLDEEKSPEVYTRIYMITK